MAVIKYSKYAQRTLEKEDKDEFWYETLWEGIAKGGKWRGNWKNTFINPHVKGKVLDCACGAGTQAVSLAQEGFEVDAFDWSKTAIKSAKKQAKEAGVKVNFKRGDLRNPPFPPDNQYDTILMIDIIEHFKKKDIQDIIINIANKFLKDDGNIIIVTPNLLKEANCCLFSLDRHSTFDALGHQCLFSYWSLCWFLMMQCYLELQIIPMASPEGLVPEEINNWKLNSLLCVKARKGNIKDIKKTVVGWLRKMDIPFYFRGEEDELIKRLKEGLGEDFILC